MSLEREYYQGPIAFSCDECGEVEETRCSDFNGALAKIRAHGWIARNERGEWFHYCGDCK